MDSITQATLGAAMGELVLGRKLGWRGAAWGAFLGTLPDLDVLFRPLLNDVEGMYWHRGISHSALFTVLATVLIGLLLAARWSRRYEVSKARAMIFVFLAYSTHIIIDCFTTYGTSVWSPFSGTREWWNILFIIDPLFTLPMIFGLLASVIFMRKRQTRRRGVVIGLFISCLYVVFAIMMKTQATTAVILQIKGTDKRLVSTSPVPLQTILWRVLVADNESYFVGYWSPFDNDGEIQWEAYEKNHRLIDPYEDSAELEALQWFSQDVWLAKPGENSEVYFVDMRFGELRLLDESGTVQPTPMFVWKLVKDDKGEVDFGGYRVDRTTLNLPKTLGRIWRRMQGDEVGW